LRGILLDDQSGQLSPTRNYPPDQINHVVGLLQHLEIIKPQYEQIPSLKPDITLTIRKSMSCFKMLSTVNFNDELGFWSVKIDNKVVDNLLTIEPNAELVTSYSAPESSFCISHTVSEAAGIGEE
jgi:hypothetical protein